MTEGSLPRPNPNVAFKIVDDEAVLVHLETNRIFTLTETGARFWQLLAEGRDRPAIEQELLREYDVAEPDLVAEVDSLLRELAAEDLVERTAK
jgi:Coenzyme PQQ synthesis protein D (PqqD)